MRIVRGIPPVPVFLRILLLLSVTLVAGGRTALAQTPDGADNNLRHRIEVNAGGLYFDAGNDRNCDDGLGLSAGAALQSTGTWLASVGVEAVLAGSGCEDSEHWFDYKGQTVRESGPIEYSGGPRISFLGGRAFQAGSLTLEPAARVGVVRLGVDDSLEEDASWVWSMGAVLTVRSPRLPLGLKIEYGRYAAPSKYFDMQDQVVRDSHTWRSMLQFSLSRTTPQRNRSPNEG